MELEIIVSVLCELIRFICVLPIIKNIFQTKDKRARLTDIVIDDSKMNIE